MFLKSTKDWKHAGRMFELSVFFDINKYSCCNLPRYVIFFRLTLDKLFFYFKHKNTYEFLTGPGFDLAHLLALLHFANNLLTIMIGKFPQE